MWGNRSWRLAVGISLALVLLSLTPTAVGATPAAKPHDDEIEIVGTITALDEAARTLIVTATDAGGAAHTYTVAVPHNFRFDKVALGTVVEVEGTLDDAGTLVARKLKIERGNAGGAPDDDRDADRDADDNGDAPYCSDPTASHPVAARLAAHYDTAEDQIRTWFCDDGMGFGQIMLALQTAKSAGGTAQDYLTRRAEGQGWGQIWKAQGLIGRGRTNHPRN